VPTLGYLEIANGLKILEINANKFRDHLMKYAHSEAYKITKQIIRALFLQQGLHNSAAALTTLHGHRQNFWNREKNILEKRDINEYFESLNHLIMALNQDINFPIDLPSLFWIGAIPQIHRRAETANWHVPPPTPNETNAGQFIRLNECREAALHFEREMRDAMDVFPQSTRGVAPRAATTTRAFMTAYEGNEAREVRALECGDDATTEEETSGLCPELAQYHDAYVMMSAAEEAMAKAAGQARPKRRCYGCDGTRYNHEADTHLYGQCPHNQELDIKENAARGFKKFLEERKPAAVRTSRDWREQGYASQEQCEAYHTIAEPTTQPVARKHMVQYLRNKGTPTPTGTAAAAIPDQRSISFVTATTPAHVATPGPASTKRAIDNFDGVWSFMFTANMASNDLTADASGYREYEVGDPAPSAFPIIVHDGSSRESTDPFYDSDLEVPDDETEPDTESTSEDEANPPPFRKIFMLRSDASDISGITTFAGWKTTD